MTEASDLAHQAGFPTTSAWIAHLATKNARLTQQVAELTTENERLNLLIDTHTCPVTERYRERT